MPPSARRIAVDAIVILHVGGLGVVAGLLLLILALSRDRLADEWRARHRGRATDGAGSQRAQEVTTAYGLVISRLGFHRDFLLVPARLARERESLLFDLQEHPADHSYVPIKSRRRRRLLDVGEQPSH